ncbi:MAG TPA: dTMP kinase [Gammaproteobacteria bacterium]|nr:dTMP kinase [Gammaproteobacteria bacterium]
MSGRFITIEGIEGVGKSTNLAFVRDHLADLGHPVIVTREPGGTELGEAIRGLLLDHRNTAMSDDTELLLMFAARAQHLTEVVRPALGRGQWVLCDRFTDATYAYQGGGRGVARERIAALEQWVQDGLRPDLTLLLDVPEEIGLERAGRRGELDRFERERAEFFGRVREAYLALAAQDPGRFRVIDASRPLEAVQAELRTVLKSAVAEWTGGQSA